MLIIGILPFLGGDGFDIGVKQHNIYNIWDPKKKSKVFFYPTKTSKAPQDFV
jgi:hypothetical protein